ncbi:aminotransferase class V-fold PLP-dependent enzyme [Streptomyces phytophilus]|uniref:aminotransferase class V-fold PLP-dependent enzyme n=1 Tax=Streptomyces phytophilus TaxID=722715 RepID=UPI0015F10E4B|nr:aminotransferase class V-fold PLP-dependent enzyme [Streptomyces phytophilus]
MNDQIKGYLRCFHEPPGYLDFARFGPVSADVRDVLARAAHSSMLRPYEALAEFHAEEAAAAQAAAELLGASPHEVALLSSTSHGMFAAAHALRGPGDVLVSRGDFPAAVYPWLRVAERHAGVRVRMVDGPLTADTVRPHLDGRLLAVSVCAVDAATGFRAPLAEIKDLIGPRRVLVVDAVQALGVVEFAVDAADVLASGGQKWLRSGWGAALLLVRDRVADLLRPGLGGWSGVQDPLGSSAHPHPALPGAAAHKFTNPDGPAVAALRTGLDLVRAVGVKQIAGLATEALGLLLDAARAAGAEVATGGRSRGGRHSRSGSHPPSGSPRNSPGAAIGRLRLPGADPGLLHRALLDSGLVTTLRGDWIRLSPHATTHPDTSALLASALRAAGSRRG